MVICIDHDSHPHNTPPLSLLRRRQGDLIIGFVTPNKDTRVFDFRLNTYHLARGERLFVVAALGNRESSTHVNGGIPDGGLVVEMGTRTNWIAGESGAGRLRS